MSGDNGVLQTGGAPKKSVSLWLVASLAVNALLLGVVGGRMIANGHGHDRWTDRGAYGARALDAMPDDVRRKIKRDIVSAWRDSHEEREAMTDARRSVLDAAMREPYDEAEVADALSRLRDAENALRAKIHGLIAQHLEAATPEERRAILESFSGGPGARRARGPHSDGEERFHHRAPAPFDDRLPPSPPFGSGPPE